MYVGWTTAWHPRERQLTGTLALCVTAFNSLPIAAAAHPHQAGGMPTDSVPLHGFQWPNRDPPTINVPGPAVSSPPTQETLAALLLLLSLLAVGCWALDACLYALN